MDKRHLFFSTLAILVALQLVAFGSSIHAIFHARTPQAALGWTVALYAIPGVTVPAYWVLGRSDFDDHVRIHRSGNERLNPIAKDLIEQVKPYSIPDSELVESVETAGRLASLPVLRANKTDLLVDGEQTYQSIMEGIDEAEHYILMQWYIARDDGIGRQIQQKLIEKARQGIDVYFLYDFVGSADLTESFTHELEYAGVQVASFIGSESPISGFQVNFRNHRKITVIDGKVSWIGGLNLGDEYLGLHDVLTPWRDAHVRIEGPAALMPQLAFANDWYFATEQVPDVAWEPTAATGSDESALVIASGPADNMEAMRLVFIHAINSAKERLWISTPYFVPDEAVIAALQLAGLRGVDVRILLPATNDSELVKLAAYSYFEDAGKTGVNFYWFTEGFLHRKLMLIDDTMASIGSANMDNRSFRLNFEITGLFMSPETIGQVEKLFERDLEYAEPIDPDLLEEKSFWFRLGVHTTRLFSPLL